MLCPVRYVVLLQSSCKAILFPQGSDRTNIYIRSTDDPLVDAENDKHLPDELRFVKYSSIVWTHDSKGFFYQVRFNLFSSPMLIYSARGFPTAQQMDFQVRIRWNWRSGVTRMLRSFTTESAPTRVCLLIYFTPFLTDDLTQPRIYW